MLASASPRRASLLAAAGLHFEIDPGHIDERQRPREAAAALGERLAREKAQVVARVRSPGTIVLAGDTIVVRDGAVLGKPADRDEAAAMLASLAGRQHEVLSAVALSRAPTGPTVSGVAVSRVRFAPLDETAMQAYLDTGEWEGKAGGYAIQGRAGAFAQLLDGELDTVVGLPLALVGELAERLAAVLAEDVT